MKLSVSHFLEVLRHDEQHKKSVANDAETRTNKPLGFARNGD